MVKYIDENLVKIAREQDVLDILMRDGVPLIKRGGEYRHREHDSLVVRPDKGFYWFSKDYGSRSPIDYYKEVEGMDFKEAVLHVLDVMNMDFEKKNVVNNDYGSSSAVYIKNEFKLPERDVDNKKVFAYLIKTRGIDADVVKDMVRKGYIYQDKKFKNAVFIGKDYEGNIVSAFKRSTRTHLSENAWKRGDEEGSQKEYRFRIENMTNRVVNIFESEIDLLSYVSMQDKRVRNENYISLGGLSEKALTAFLENRNNIEQINICVDNDKRAWEFCKNIANDYGDKFKLTREVSCFKDFNEDLQNGVPYERNRIDVLCFAEETVNMTKEEKIKRINEIFSEAYQGKQVELKFPENVSMDINKANINMVTKQNFKFKDKIESWESYHQKLNIGIEENLLNLVESSKYVRSKEEVKSEQNAIHRNTKGWHYFNKPLVIDGEIYNMVIDVRERNAGDMTLHKIRVEEMNILRKREQQINVDKDINRDTKEEKVVVDEAELQPESKQEEIREEISWVKDEEFEF